jgi:predicted transposase YdaD
VEAMLGLTLEQTRVYQEAKAEGRSEQKAEMLLEQTRIYQEAKAEGRSEMLKATVPLLLKTGKQSQPSQPLRLLLYETLRERSSLRDAQRERNDILIFIISSNNKNWDAPV